MPQASAGVVIVGGGVAGSLLALALRDQAVPVTLVGGAPPGDPAAAGAGASAISYGALPGWPLAATPLARLAAGASRSWRRLQRRHGDLGFGPARLQLSTPGPPLWALPFAQVDTTTLSAHLPQVLAEAGVDRRASWVEQLRPASAGGWRVSLRDGSGLCTPQLVLAAGAHCRQLWPDLPGRLRSSWAAVLELSAYPASHGRLACWLPGRFERVALERRALELTQPAWVVDPALVPWGGRALLGQHTQLQPGLPPGLPPGPEAVEQQLRAGIAALPWGADLWCLPGSLRQAAVAFCSDGMPLVGPVAQAPGLWVFTGFSAGFSQVPVLAPLLAQALAGNGVAAEVALRRLRRLGVATNAPRRQHGD